jgi:glutathione S-transferase
MSYKLFIANKNYSSWSMRPWVLMTVLGIPFEEHLHAFSDDNRAFFDFSPSGKVPCLHDGDHDEGLRVWDSLAIIETLAETHPQVWPENRAARAWARSAAAEMHSGFHALRSQCSMNCGLRVQLFEISPSLQQDLDRLNTLWQQGLDRFGGPFLAGKAFTAVDALFAPVALRAQTYGLPLHPAYVQQLLALPAVQAWYQAGLAETWREPAHDRETLQHGTLLADLRAGA